MTGVGMYALRMLEAVHSLGESAGIILPSGSPYAASFPRFRVHFTSVDLTAHPLTDAFEQIAIPWMGYRHGYGSFVSFEGRVPAFHPGLRTYSLIYDLSYLKVPGSHGRKYSAFLSWNLRISSLTATRIVTISKAVRDDLQALAGVPTDKVLIAYPADSRLSLTVSAPLPGLDSPFFLAVGMTNSRKNLGNLIRGFALFRRSAPEFRLLITGNRELIAGVGTAIGMEGVVNLGFVDDGSLRALYERAQALVYPSLDEGFGIPLIDALDFGCPVLCSDIPVFREVVEGAALYFDPKSPASIASCMETGRVRRDSAEGSRIRERYSWEKSAKGLLEGIRNSRT